VILFRFIDCWLAVLLFSLVLKTTSRKHSPCANKGGDRVRRRRRSAGKQASGGPGVCTALSTLPALLAPFPALPGAPRHSPGTYRESAGKCREGGWESAAHLWLKVVTRDSVWTSPC